MVGNDIVDLKQAALESNWQRKGFLNKVFTKNEKAYIQNSKDPFLMVWQLWSMKESAYKINVQQYKYRFFNPKKIECTLLDNVEGIVKINGASYTTFSNINNAFIYSIAALKNSDKIQSKYFKIDNSGYKAQHQSCKTKLKEAVSQWYNLEYESVKIEKSILGIPKLYKNGNALEIACSITHHGNYGAYAII